MQDTTKTEDVESEDVQSKASEIAQFVEYGIRSQMEDRPYVTIAAAFSLGYVLGGGLPRFAVRALGAAGARYAATKVMRSLLNGG